MEREELINLVNENFTSKDIWSTWAYDKENLPKDLAEVKADLKEFIGKQKDWLLENEGEELKYIATIHNGRGQMYLHLITNFPDRDKLESLWEKGGRVHTKRLIEDVEDKFGGIARYMYSNGILEILLSLDGESNDSK